jgi:hypothetical protein
VKAHVQRRNPKEVIIQGLKICEVLHANEGWPDLKDLEVPVIIVNIKSDPKEYQSEDYRK